jgi:flagellar basal body-associated protein FliL
MYSKMDNEEEPKKKSSSTSGDSNKWIYLGIFLTVIIIAIVLYYFGTPQMQDDFTRGTIDFMGQLIWQSV